MLKLTTDKHEASRGLSATAELLVIVNIGFPYTFEYFFQVCSVFGHAANEG